ncbi:hypothetical protein L2E82_40156 [Cichorium intybus]|uniref:Uncharacterized protein n=1 Tax=Cichorium intybus TaxID=13427 RepID=A0ACB9AK78_CICIN|nr:hypothetical protein L2E82_40156 [Cichorium intybus]
MHSCDGRLILETPVTDTATLTDELRDKIIKQVKYCSDNNKRLIYFSTCEEYGKTIGGYLPQDSPLRHDPAYYILKEDISPCIFSSIEKQRWSYACVTQLIERIIYAEGAENGLEFTIVRPFNWISPRTDFILGIDGPSEGVPRVLACFSNNLLRREPLKLVDGGQSQRTFVYIKMGDDYIQDLCAKTKVFFH